MDIDNTINNLLFLKEKLYNGIFADRIGCLDEAIFGFKVIQRFIDQDFVLRECLRIYGQNPQMDMCIEEMSELTKALLKYRRKQAADGGRDINPTDEEKKLDEYRADIIDELADVRIMCRQMELLFHAEDEVEERIGFKIERQKKRLNQRS